MKKLNVALAAIGAVVLTSPLLISAASAHPVGERCYFQRIDEDGIVRNGSDYCHHVPGQYRERPRAGFYLYFNPGSGYYYDRRPRMSYAGGRQEQVCLVTFFKRSQVAAGADVTVQRAQVLPLHVARRLDGPNDRRRIFDYGSNRKTRETCRYLNNINN